MKTYEITPQQSREFTHQQYQAAEGQRITKAEIEIGQDLLLLKKIPEKGSDFFILQAMIRVEDLNDIEDGKKEVTYSGLEHDGNEWATDPETLILSFRSYVEELPGELDKVADWEDYPQLPRAVGYLIKPERLNPYVQ